jgi:hypothetical protein
MPEHLTRITAAEAGSFSQLERELQGQQLGLMNGVADRIVKGGRYCDQPTFLASFFSNLRLSTGEYRLPRNYDRQALPQYVQERLARVDDLEYALGEPYAQVSTPDGFGSFVRIGLIVRSEKDDAGVAEYTVGRGDSLYFGYISVNSVSLADNGSFSKPEPEASSLELLHLTRDDLDTSARIDENDPMANVAIGMPAIRRAIRDNPRLIYDGMVREVENYVSELRQYVGEAALASY